ncbi:hypothetical protein Bca4012_036086 [Brassica carinata]
MSTCHERFCLTVTTTEQRRETRSNPRFVGTIRILSPETCPPEHSGDRNFTHHLRLNSFNGERHRSQFRDLIQSQRSRHLLPHHFLHRRIPSNRQSLLLKQSRKQHQVTVGNRNPTRTVVDNGKIVRCRNREPTAHPHRMGATPEA